MPSLASAFPPPRMTLDEIATAAAAVIADARAARLAPPYGIHAHDFGPPSVSLYITEHQQDRDIWQALSEWASHYGTEVTSGPGVTPGTIYAVVQFHHDRIRYEVTAVIHPADDQDEPEQNAA